jgi:hypothetical protein
MIRYQSEGAHDGGEAEVARASVEELFPHPEELEEEETKLDASGYPHSQ